MQATPVRSPTPGAAASAGAGAYRHVGIETGVAGASAHQLVSMLFDGVQDSIAQARGAIRANDIATKGRAIARALRIVDEGLHGALDAKGGGVLAADLGELYQYITRRLAHANLHNDDAALAECAKLIEPVRSAWRTIGAQARHEPVGSAK
jgi:flagellar secretion chaperone FliS